MTAPEGEGPKPTTSGSGGGNPFTRKLGPLPLWAWMGVGLAAALAYTMWRKNKAGTPTTATTTNPNSTGTQTASQTPPFIIQNYPPSGGVPVVTPPTGGSQSTGPATPTQSYVTTGVQHPSGIRDDNALGLAVLTYGLKNDKEQDAVIGAGLIRAANPQINWAKPIPAGTTINVPLTWENPIFTSGKTPYNQGAPAGNTPLQGVNNTYNNPPA